VPVSAKFSPSPPHPANPSVTPPIPTVSSSGNGKRAPPSAQQQQQPQPQPAAPRFPPREVPPRFRQQEHKQLLKRGQPLPAGTLATTGQPGASSPPQTPASPSKQHTELPHQSGLGAQYENLHWGHQPSNRIWDQVIIDQSDTEAWPSISYSESHAPPECTTDIDCTTEISSSNMSIATGAGQQSHFSAHHPSSKNSGNHSGNMVSNQGGASRGWGTGPTHCPSAIGSEGKTDSMPTGGRGQSCWGSSNFNLNLNPNANPAAWPVLGHEGAGMGGGGPEGTNPPPPPNLCSPASAPSAQERGGSMGSTNENPVGGSGNSAWGSILPPDPTESRHLPSTNVSFSDEPQNLNTDGPNNTKQQSLSPIHGLPSWGSVPVDMGPLVQPQVNGEGGSVWGNGDAKPTGSKESAWDSGPPSGPGILTPWGRGGSNAGAWGRSAYSGGGDWGKHSSEAKGWETSDSPRQEQPVIWSNAPANEGSNDSLEGRSRRMERPHGELDAPPSLPRQDLDPRVLSNTGWGQTPVRQHTAWELEEMARSDRKNDTGADSWSTGSSSSSSSGPPLAPATASANPAAAHMSNSDGKGEGSSSNTSVAPGWGNPAPVIATPASNQPSSSWGEAVGKKAPSGPGGCTGSSNSTGPKGGMSWGQEEKSPSWDDPPAKPKPQSWGEGPKPGHGWGTGASGGGDCGEPREEKNGVTAASWEENPQNAEWGKPGAGAGAGVGGGWMEAQRPSAPVQGWGGKPQDSSNSNVESWGGAGTVKQCGTGWGGGGRGGREQEQGGEPTGWEEPSPPSMRRKMEIDDGTSAWGDPSTYNKTVNLWDKNNPVIQSSPGNAAASNNHGNAAASNNHGNAAASNNHGNAAASNNHGNAAASNNHGNAAASNNHGNAAASNNHGNAAASNNHGNAAASNNHGNAAASNNHGNAAASNNHGNAAASNNHGNAAASNNHGNAAASNNHGNAAASNNHGNAAASNNHGNAAASNNHGNAAASNNHGNAAASNNHGNAAASNNHGNAAASNNHGNAAASNNHGGGEKEEEEEEGEWEGGVGASKSKGANLRVGKSPPLPPCAARWRSTTSSPGNAAASNNHGNAAASNNHGNAAASNNHGNAAASNNHGKHAASNSIHHHHHSSHAQNHSHAQSHSQSHSHAQSHNHTPGHSQSHTQNHSHAPSNTHNSPQEQTTPHQPSAPQNRSVLAGPGWGDLPSARPKPEPSWGEPVSPATAVDNGTSAWGKPPGSCGGWGDNPVDPSGPYGRVNPRSGPAPCKPASKSMQDGWGGSPDELGGWDREEGDVWNSGASQESNSPCGSWGNLPKKGPQKVIKVPSKQDEAWILSRLIKQLTDMGFPREPAEEALKSNSMNLDQAMRWGDLPSARPKPEPSWGEPVSPATAVDNGTSAWGKPPGSCGGWGDNPVDPSGPYGRVNPRSGPAPCKPASKSMQDGWGGSPDELGGWDREEGDVWNSGASQESNSPCGSWGNLPKKGPQKVIKVPSKQDEAWILSRLIKQLTDMGFPDAVSRSQADIVYIMKCIVVFFGLALYLTKVSFLMQSSMFGNSGAAQFRAMQQQQQQPAVPPLNSSQPSVRSQVPQFLSPQVQAQLLQFAAKNIGLNPALLTSPMNPQHMTLLNQLYQLQLTCVSVLAWFSGAIPAGPSIGPPGKSPMDDFYSPYNLIPSTESPASPLVAPDNWTQAKSANDKICNGTNISWPPEFCPGVPWKGLQNIDPETDPNVTPGSVPSGPTINTNIQDVNRYLLRDRSGGLTNTKPSSTWGGNSLGLTPGWSSSYTSGTTWSTDSSARTSSWLVLRNLTPQIDGSTLRTLCMQHGPLLTFHLNLTQGNAVVRYSSKEEAAKAQKSLHMCVLGNTTILAEFAGEEEVNRFFAQGQSLTPTTSWQAHPGTNQTRLGGTGAGHWNSSGGKGGSELLWGGVPQYSSLWGPPGGEDSRGIGSPTPINTLLPGDLLSGETM
ncbi:UNVERIFIED_CONTAM: hypothetical protein FKN15_076052, partial [Acipenser sinensis]